MSTPENQQTVEALAARIEAGIAGLSTRSAVDARAALRDLVAQADLPLDLIALTLACYGDAVNTRLADMIPQEVWDSLTERGLIEHGRDYSGDGTCTTTSAGRDYLIDTTQRIALARLDDAR